VIYKCKVYLEVDGAALQSVTIIEANSDDQAQAVAVDYFRNVGSFIRIVQVVVSVHNPKTLEVTQ
jgi:hypothetical protein